jgi:predicted transcriptional regulator
MEVHFTPELEAKLTRSAAQQGRNPDEVVQDVLRRYFEEEARLSDAVKRGQEALERSEYLTYEQVGQRIEKEASGTPSNAFPSQKAAGGKTCEPGLGSFGSPEDSALLDDVVSLAYEERRRPTKPLPAL